MRRLFPSITETGQGAVYRHVGTTNLCINSFVVEELPPPDCEIFPTTSENIGSFPYNYGSQDEIDEQAFISDFSVLDGASYDPAYPNMWHELDGSTKTNILLYASSVSVTGKV